MNDILKNLQNIFRDVFDDSNLVITRESNASNVPDWDSLAQINLVSAIEQDFRIKFSISDFLTLQNVGDMIDLMEKKLKEKI